MKKLLRTLSGEKVSPPPVWLMRQAGRYLPEYRDLRAQAGSFWALADDPVMAAEVTMQPVRRFNLDAAIVFSDILVVPRAMGVDTQIEEGKGPRLSPVRTLEDVDLLETDPQGWQATLETLKRVRSMLLAEGFDDATLIGFSGAPWTLACYMVQGDGRDHSFRIVREIAAADPFFFDRLINRLTTAVTYYVLDQISAGAEVIQIFDSWAGAVPDRLFDRYVVAPTRRVVDAVKNIHPHVPVIGFPRLIGDRIERYAVETGVQAVSLDSEAAPAVAANDDGRKVAVQGNLDPALLAAGGEALDRGVDDVLQGFSGRPFVFNLGHGVLPQTPPENVTRLVERVRR